MRSGHRPSGAVDDEPADQSSRHTSDKRTPNVAERFRPSRNLYTEKTILSAALTSLARQANDRRKPSAHPCLRSAAGGLGCSDLDPEVRRGTCRDRDTQHRPAYDSRRRAGKSGRRVRLRREHATQDPTQRPVRAGVRSMRHARPLAPRPGSLEGLSAADLLGPDHPLVRAAETVSTATRQSIAIATVFAGSVVAASAGARPAVSIAVSAGIVLAAVVLRAAASRQQQSDRAIDLILQGRETLPVTAIQRQRRRLIDPRTTLELARAIETVISQATVRPKLRTRGTIPLFDVRVVAPATAELAAVAALLREPCPVARGVARAERLLTDARSPLYGHSARALCDELQHVTRLLDM